MHLIPVILCGEEESRQQLISQELHQNPFIRSIEGYSLLQKSILRGALLPGVKKIVTLSNKDIFPKIKDEFNEINLANQSISFLLQPFQQNTAALVTAAVLHIAQFHNEDSLILLLALQHLNIDQDTFQHTISIGCAAALSGKLVTFGMPTYETNTKYDDPGTKNKNMFLWNSNLFLFKAGTLLEAVKELRPDILSATLTCMKHSELLEENNSLRIDLNHPEFFSISDGSINDEIIKKSDKTVVISCDLDWIDHIFQWQGKSE